MQRRTAEWVRKAEKDIESARTLAAMTPPKRNAAGFHCQQSAEKYFKALLQELGLPVPRTHNLIDLIDLLLPHDPTLRPPRRGLKSLTRYAVEYRYPGWNANTKQMQSALAKYACCYIGMNANAPSTATAPKAAQRLLPGSAGLSLRTV